MIVISVFYVFPEHAIGAGVGLAGLLAGIYDHCEKCICFSPKNDQQGLGLMSLSPTGMRRW